MKPAKLAVKENERQLARFDGQACCLFVSFQRERAVPACPAVQSVQALSAGKFRNCSDAWNPPFIPVPYIDGGPWNSFHTEDGIWVRK